VQRRPRRAAGATDGQFVVNACTACARAARTGCVARVAGENAPKSSPRGRLPAAAAGASHISKSSMLVLPLSLLCLFCRWAAAA